MPAPAEFAQIIVIGLEAQVWLLLYALAFSSWRVPAEVPEGILLFVITAASLVLGVIVDRLADSAYTAVRDSSPARRVLKRLKVRVDDTPKWMISTMRSRTLESDDPRGRFLEYQRTRFRIARATTFNLVMLIPAVALFLGLRTDLGVGALLDSVILIAIATGFTLSATERIGGAWVRALSEAYRQWAKQHPEQAGNDMDRTAGSLGTVDPRCFRVAAMCYRDGPHGPEFLVVKTSDGRFWTIPKGHVERGEAPWEAASREAKEEGGVVGEPPRTAFTAYRYPSGDSRCQELLVEAYLLPVERQSLPDPGERHRDQAWVDTGKAKSLLAAGRTLLHGLEDVRLIDEARKEIEGLSTV